MKERCSCRDPRIRILRIGKSAPFSGRFSTARRKCVWNLLQLEDRKVKWKPRDSRGSRILQPRGCRLVPAPRDCPLPTTDRMYSSHTILAQEVETDLARLSSSTKGHSPQVRWSSPRSVTSLCTFVRGGAAVAGILCGVSSAAELHESPEAKQLTYPATANNPCPVAGDKPLCSLLYFHLLSEAQNRGGGLAIDVCPILWQHGGGGIYRQLDADLGEDTTGGGRFVRGGASYPAGGSSGLPHAFDLVSLSGRASHL